MQLSKNRLVLATLLTFLLAEALSAQQLLSSPSGISIKHPENWLLSSKDEMAESLKTLDFSDEQLQKLLKSNGSILIWGFIKYERNTVAGIIPTIQVRLLANPTKNFETFKVAYQTLREKDKDIVTNKKVIKPVTEASIASRKALTTTFTYELSKDGETYTVRTRSYAVPVGKHFFQIAFIDEPSKEDCSKEFDEVTQTIRIGDAKP